MNNVFSERISLTYQMFVPLFTRVAAQRRWRWRPRFPSRWNLTFRLFHFSFDKVGIFRPGEAAALIKAANETDSAHKGNPKSKLGGEMQPVP